MSEKLIDKYGANGLLLSPKLPRGVKNYLIDIDGTVSEDIPNEEPERMLTCDELPGAKDYVNNLFNDGHIITFFSSRLEEHRTNTEKWLNNHGFKYHGIIFGKPRGGNYHWIDDRSVKATRFSGKFTKMVKEQREVEVFGK